MPLSTAHPYHTSRHSGTLNAICATKPLYNSFFGVWSRTCFSCFALGIGFFGIFELGNTKVLAAVHGPRECRRPSERLEDRLLIKCEVSMAAFSTGERRRRTKGDRRTNELSTFVRGCLETCVSTELMARSQLDVTIQVLQADGGVRAAAINAAVLAIVDAGIPMKDTMAACSAGFLDDTALLDLNYMEVRIPISLGYFFD